MTRTVTVLQDFDTYEPMHLVNFARNTVTGMTGNAAFPTPDVALSVISAAAQKLQDKQQVVDSNNGGIDATTQRDAAEKDLIIKLKANARYVNHLAYGDKDKILSSGYLASADQTQPAQRGGVPEVEIEVSRTPGTAAVTFQTVAGAKAYVLVIAPVAGSGTLELTPNGVVMRGGDAPVDVQIITDTHRKMTLTGLVSGGRYRAWGYTINSAGISELSGELRFIPQ